MISNETYHTATLSNGLRVVHRASASAVVYCGLGLRVGSRHEQPGEEGVAHFCEHMAFKGTQRRTALQILNSLERVGGDLNAYTNKEDTVFYAAILREHLPRAVDVLLDIVFCSQFPAQEASHEIDVICDEIESYNDSPSELIYDEFENLLFQGHPLGHNILGTREQVRQYTSQHARHFTSRHYLPSNAVFFAYGDIDFGRLVRLLSTRCDALSVSGSPAPGPQAASPSAPMDLPAFSATTTVLDRHTHQAHVMLGTQAYAFTDESRRLPLYLLNNILGGPGMNARLNLLLRERHGLVYTVESALASYSDTGAWSVYFGCDRHDVKRCLQLVRRELDRLMQHPLSPRQLAAAKRQLKGQLAIACDNREQFALDLAKHFLHEGQLRDLASLAARIDALTASQLQDVAQELFQPDRLATLILQ